MDDSCLKHVRTRMELDLHPNKMGNVQAGVYELLNEMLLRYDEGLEGVVLAVGQPRILSHEAEVHTYFPLCRVQLIAPFVLFCPLKGAMLTGCVTQLGPDFVGMLVAGVINASVAQSEMRSGFVWHPEAQEWRSQRHAQHVISVDSYVCFHVTSIERTDLFFAIKGSLKAKTTGSVAFLTSTATKDGTQTAVKPDKPDKASKSAKKDKAKHTDVALSTQGVDQGADQQAHTEAATASQRTGTKDKKRERQTQGAPEQVQGQDGQQETKKRKKVQANGDISKESNVQTPSVTPAPQTNHERAATGHEDKSRQMDKKDKHAQGASNGGTGQGTRTEEKKVKQKKKKDA